MLGFNDFRVWGFGLGVLGGPFQGGYMDSRCVCVSIYIYVIWRSLGIYRM